MEEYRVLLQIILLIICLFLLYLLVKYIRSIMIKNRLSDYSINLGDDNLEYKSFYKIILVVGNFLDSLVIFNGLARTYKKFINDDSKLRREIDFISLKFVFGILMILLYLFLVILYNDEILLYLVLICFVLGFLLPDFYWVFKDNHHKSIGNQDILKVVIIMENSYKVNRSTEQAVNDVINRTDGNLRLEFKKVLADMRIGLDVSDAFYRLYYRTRLEAVRRIANSFKIIDVSGISAALVFEEIEKYLIMDERFEQEMNVYYSVNKIAHLVFLLLPLIFIVSILLFNKRYIDVLLSEIGVFLILILGIIYLLYMLFLRRIIGGSVNDKKE